MHFSSHRQGHHQNNNTSKSILEKKETKPTLDKFSSKELSSDSQLSIESTDTIKTLLENLYLSGTIA